MFVEGGWLLEATMDDYLQKDSPKIAKEVLGHFVDGFRPILWLTTSPPQSLHCDERSTLHLRGEKLS